DGRQDLRPARLYPEAFQLGEAQVRHSAARFVSCRSLAKAGGLLRHHAWAASMAIDSAMVAAISRTRSGGLRWPGRTGGHGRTGRTAAPRPGPRPPGWP